MAGAAPPSGPPDPPPLEPEEPLSREYLSLRQAGEASEEEEEASRSPPPPAGAPGGERCRAMMEVVKKDAVGVGGKWKVSKLVVDHNHELEVAPVEGGGAGVPVLGMEFDSADDAKGFYQGYGEKAGFKARTGSNRRSVGTGAMIMQRFLCCRGNYVNRKSKAAKGLEEVEEGAAEKGKGEVGPCKKRGRKPGKKNAQAPEVEMGGGIACTEIVQAVPSRRSSRRGRDENDVVRMAVENVIEPEERNDEAVDGARNGSAGANDEEEEDEMEEEVGTKEKRGRGRPRKAVTEGNALQACDLGASASQCNNDDRKKILDKYLSKRQTRPVSGRPAKIVSRQALAERRKRGVGGRFLASEGLPPSRQLSERRSKRLEKQNLKEEEKPESKKDEITEAEADPETEVVAGPGGEPKIGMVFVNEDKAYEFYVSYAGSAGFNVRKGCSDKTANNVMRSRAYVCSKEGFRLKSVTAEQKKPRPDARTGCQAHMTIKITTSGKYVVTEYVADHNHDLETPLVDIQILRSQKLLAKLQQPLDLPKVVLIPNDYKNYIRTRSTKDMPLGDAQAICEYLQRMKGKNPSFFYSIQVDEDDQIRNVFWSDIKSMMDYNYFGDVLYVDTRYSTGHYGFAAVDEDPKFSVSKRYNSLCRTLYKIAAKAAENTEAHTFMENQYDQLLEQVELILQEKLHDKSSLSTIMKNHQQNLIQNDASNSEPRRASAKKRKNVEMRRRQQSPLESSKKQKGRQDLLEPEECEVPLRNEPSTIPNDIPNHLTTPTNQFLSPSHIMQVPYVTQQFGLNSLQGFPGISPFGQMQEPSHVHLQQPHLQQSHFLSGPQIHQAPPPDIQSLQFLSSNPQLGHQTTDSQYTIPVWDFL
ncbi:hypothetical protein BRADI_1g06907v3 [Brachypodium distachyon]|uniref:Protein FAR1-RELATED SEQUENCE n=1 Tax=Brachypodium distachyon TaxID=15368 RepID=A0A0Q3N8C9_BRADI|nr:hypothetical protein BRADI_1g06907v3 [Brachypodium distachyon]